MKKIITAILIILILASALFGAYYVINLPVSYDAEKYGDGYDTYIYDKYSNQLLLKYLDEAEHKENISSARPVKSSYSAEWDGKILKLGFDIEYLHELDGECIDSVIFTGKRIWFNTYLWESFEVTDTVVKLSPAEQARLDKIEGILREQMPKTDGSTSTLPLDIAVHSAILGISEEEASRLVKHTKTYTSLENLVHGDCELIIRTPMSDDEREYLAKNEFHYTEIPVAGEGFVFVVNKSNPVDTLSIKQLKDIYSGKITNWKDVGGNDLPIIPYQRNADSGSQNYMISFMGDTELMEPVTEPIPAAMSGILNAVANYDNAEGAIGYSVYAYSDGMYEDMAKIKYIKVNGIEPSFESFSDGSYPLLGYNYAVFNSSLPEDAPARAMAEWMQSDIGQKVIAKAGYVPYRKVVGLTMPETNQGTLYSAKGTGVGKASEADYYYELKNLYDGIPEIKDENINKIIRDYIASETERINSLHDAEFDAFLEQRKTEGYAGIYYYPAYRPSIEYTVKNGYLSILSGMWWHMGAQYSPDCYYKPVGAVFDLYTGVKLEISDLFPKDYDFVPELNRIIKEQIEGPANPLGGAHETFRDFSGLMDGEFICTADSLIFTSERYMKDGVVLSLKELREDMIISNPRDMSGIFKTDDKCIYKVIYDDYYTRDYCTPVQFPNGSSENGNITYWLLDSDKGLVSKDVCEKINDFVLNLHEEYFTPEKLLEKVRAEGITEQLESYYLGPMPDAELTVIGDRYITLNGANILGVSTLDGKYKEIPLIPSAYSQYYYAFYFNADTGEELTINELFKDGYIKHTEVEYVPENIDEDSKDDVKMSAEELLNSTDVTITMINNYSQAPNKTGKPSDNDIPVTVTALINGLTYNFNVPREFIK